MATVRLEPGKLLAYTKVMEAVAKDIALYLSLFVEILGGLIIAVGLLRFLAGYLPSLFRKRQYRNNTWLRVQFGSSLTLALELLLAADILRTAVAPTWDDIGKLAAIATIRTVLNYFWKKNFGRWSKASTRKPAKPRRRRSCRKTGNLKSCFRQMVRCSG